MVYDLCAAFGWQTFVYELIIVSNLNYQPSTIDARINYITSLGISREDVNYLIARSPLLLRVPEELIGCKVPHK
jgi:hypothetical protein